jgi:hypothetical protein
MSVVTEARRQLSADLVPAAENLVREFADHLPADAVIRCLEAAMSGALLLRLDPESAVSTTVRTAREDCLALVAAQADAIAS